MKSIKRFLFNPYPYEKAIRDTIAVLLMFALMLYGCGVIIMTAA